MNFDTDASQMSGGLVASQSFSSDVSQMPEVPPRRGGHRRAHSEIAVRLPDDIMLDVDLGFTGFDMPTVSDDSGEDLISMFMDMEKLTNAGESSNMSFGDEPSGPVGSTINSSASHHSRSLSVDAAFSGSGNKVETTGKAIASGGSSRPRHRHSNSMDESSSLQVNQLSTESLDTKKAMAANKLAELALVDPKRAKRILANRQSAIRSKERKTRYISELERKVQTLQTEATTLSAQLTMLQRDTTGLTTENNELKLRLQAMEQQAQLRDALNEALREKVQRLKIATGQIASNNTNSFSMIPTGQQMPLNHPFFPQGQQSHHMNQQFQSFQHSSNSFSGQSGSGHDPRHPNYQYGGQFQGGFAEAEASSTSVNHPSTASF
eukprot:TRINITY_DN10180_c0_g1_i3.p1 TRINITY_DN10180_c0_g1~~TRINITY_DN10180_c0_g1_i3.p1  ORF type:complete len:379 (-),score=92.38 TRINITY_DN10180_c0_g1_i3:807-1943(-)